MKPSALDLFQRIFPRSTTASVLVPAMSHSRPLPPQETLWYEQVSLIQSLPRWLLFFPWWAQDLVYTPQEWSFWFRQTCGIPVIKSHWPSKAYSLENLPPVARPSAWGANVGLRTLSTVGEPLKYNYVPVCGSPTLQVWNLDFISVEPLLTSHPLLSHCGFFLLFD